MSSISVKRRLSKPKTNDHNNPSTLTQPKRSSSKSRPPPDIDPEQWGSYFDTKTRSNGPKNLKQQLKQSFPETKRKLSLDSFRRGSSDSVNSTDTMGVKDRYPAAILTTALGASNGSARSSPTTMSPLARQLSVVHETPGIDIASAIHLLQELKKTASPEELVALHRALLPLREEAAANEPSPPRADLSGSGIQRSSRRNSKLPPGLNTRGEPGEDLLKRLGDDVRRPRASVYRVGSEEQLTQRTYSGGSARANHTDDAERSETPSDEHGYPHAGAYKSGTLRITNGAASPDPARMLQNLIIPEVQEERHDQTPVMPNARDLYPDCATPAGTESFPGAFRVLHSERRTTSGRPLPPPPPDSRRGSNASDASELQFPSYDQGPDDEAYSAAQVTQDRVDESTPFNETPSFVLSDPPRTRQSRSNGSPLSLDVSNDHYENNDSPQEAPTTIAQFATRLSTVYSEDLTDEEPLGTPTDAWAKLTGEPRLLGPRGPRSNQSLKSPLKSPRPASMSQIDSGYGPTSEIPSQRYAPSQDAPRPIFPAQSDADNESLYTFNEFLSAKKPLADSAVPSSPVSPMSASSPNTEKGRKDLPSMLGLREKSALKRMSLPNSGLASSESLPSSVVSTGSEQSGKISKKLRKPMPAVERLKREKSHRVSPVSEIAVHEFPLVSEELNKSLEQRYHQPSASEISLNQRPSISPRKSSEPQSMWDDGSREMEPASEAVFVRRNPFARKRSVSRGRRNQGQAAETPSAEEKPGRFPFLRSLSRSRSRRRRASIDSADCETPSRNDFDSGSTHTGSTTPRPQLDRDASVERGNESWRTGPAIKKRPKNKGMTEEMASELARSKSRDVAGHDRIPMHDRPRMATPKSSSARSHSRNQSVGPPKSGRSVEDFLPGWHSKDNSPASSGPPKADATPRPFSMYADSIPPMPDIPLEVAAKNAKARKLMEKRKKDASTRKSMDTPGDRAAASLQNSANSSPNLGKVRSAVKAREEQERELEERMANDARNAENSRPRLRTMKTSESISNVIRELRSSGSEQSSLIGTDSRPNTADRSEPVTVASSVSSEEQQTGFSAFDKQASLWRERRRSLGTYLPSPAQLQSQGESDVFVDDRIASPEIVVSRYITPMGHEIAARARANYDPTSEAARHADSYRSLLDEEEAASATGWEIPRTDSAYSSASSGISIPKHRDLPNSLISRPPTTNQTRTASGVTTTSSVYSTQYSALPRTRSPGGRVRTPSGNFYAYDASQPEQRSRTTSLGKLNAPTASNHTINTLSPASSTDGLSTIFSDTMTVSSCGGTVRAKPKNPHQRHRFPDPQYENFQQQQQQQQYSQQQQQQGKSSTRPRPVSSNSSNLGDRYSGGLAWEWNRESGFGGSAGTRLNGETGTRRKGQRLAESFGVDLGDVPIFLCQTPDGLTAQQQQRKGYFGH
jgi:hypothetical protein